MNSGTECLSNIELCRPAGEPDLRGWRQRWQRRWRHWMINRRTRRQLAQLDTYQLKDIGVSRAQAQQEAAKPFWRD